MTHHNRLGPRLTNPQLDLPLATMALGVFAPLPSAVDIEQLELPPEVPLINASVARAIGVEIGRKGFPEPLPVRENGKLADGRQRYTLCGGWRCLQAAIRALEQERDAATRQRLCRVPIAINAESTPSLLRRISDNGSIQTRIRIVEIETICALKQKSRWDNRALGALLGYSEGKIQASVRIGEHPRILRAIADGMRLTVASTLAGLTDNAQRDAWLDKADKKKISVSAILGTTSREKKSKFDSSAAEKVLAGDTLSLQQQIDLCHTSLRLLNERLVLEPSADSYRSAIEQICALTDEALRLVTMPRETP